MARARRFDWRNLALRAGSGLILAPTALAIVWFDPFHVSFVILIAAAVAVLSYEWAVMAAKSAVARVAVTMTAAVLGVVFFTYTGHIWTALTVMLLGAVVAGLVSQGVTERRADAAYGVLYVAPACLAIIWLRFGTPEWQKPPWQGAGWITMLLATTWAADISAFAVGNALKGPKLWPRFSPNKTWSGFFGGLLGAAGAAIGVAALLMHLSLVGAGLIGLAGGLATMMGDLWESMLKRRFGVKDSGDLIPGHGGLLDRVDGLMFATLVFAAARLIVRLGWAH
jgi:phosphatidate cytidylyltransferase